MFKKWAPELNIRYNSDSSSRFLDAYESGLKEELKENINKPHKKTFAPSQFRCPRISWFRLRGVSTDIPPDPDLGLNFTAEVGTALHQIIQNHIIKNSYIEWVDVEQYMDTFIHNYVYTVEQSGVECRIELVDPPISFACDGIIKWDNRYYLLEIKSCEKTTWDKLTGPRDEHIDQVHLYSALLGISDVMMIYIDRQYGGIKCFELAVLEYQKERILNIIKDIQDKVVSHIAPDALPVGDKWCQPSYCSYYKKCKEYGRW